MDERKYLYILMFLTFVIGLVGIFIVKKDIRNYFSNLTADYTAILTIDNTISLSEKYYFNNKKDKYRMLYRNWKVPILLQNHENINRPFIKFIDGNGNGDFYVKAFDGVVFGYFENPNSENIVRQLAKPNEVGIVNPNYFSKGFYLLNVDYQLFPPIETDNKYSHLNLKLADENIPYPRIEITILDKLNIIKKVYPHIPDFEITKTDNGFKIEGKAPSNSIVELEFLMEPAQISGFKRFVPDILKKTEEANSSIIRTIVKFSENLLTIVVLFFPFLLFLFYMKFGSEKNFVVPEFLSFVPNTERKPYFVNLIFNGDSFKGDENAFYSTLLDLQQRGKIKIEENGEISIYILDTHSPDIYERMVLLFLEKYSQNLDGQKVFFPSYLESLAKHYAVKKDITNLSILKAEMDKLFRYTNPSLSKEFINKTGKIVLQIIGGIVIFLTILITLFSFTTSMLYKDIDFFPITVLLGTLTLQILIPMGSPSQFLGRWKKDYYKEKLMWNSFKNFLSDLAMIKNYSPNDLQIWREWLIYGTALDVADKVEKAMKIMNVHLPEMEKEHHFRRRMHGIYAYTGKSLTNLRTSSSGSGGGFGSGSGFGGGGAGGR